MNGPGISFVFMEITTFINVQIYNPEKASIHPIFCTYPNIVIGIFQFQLSFDISIKTLEDLKH